MDMFEKKDYLIVVDMQNDFITGALGSAEAQAIVPAVSNLVDTFNPACVYFTRDTHDENYLETEEGKNLPVPHCIKGTDGWSLIPELQEKNDGMLNYINKNSFGFDGWNKILPDSRAINSITLCGVCTDICVVSNALALKALHPEVPMKVVASCCAGSSVENHDAALAVMKATQIQII